MARAGQSGAFRGPGLEEDQQLMVPMYKDSHNVLHLLLCNKAYFYCCQYPVCYTVHSPEEKVSTLIC
jgi:hypothetical protein